MIQDVVLNLFLISWEVLCYKLFVGIFSKARRNTKNFVRLCVLLILIAVQYTLAITLSNVLIVKLISITFAETIAMCFLFKDKWKRILILTIFYQGIGMLSDYVSIVFLGKLFTGVLDEHSTNSLVVMLLSVVCKIILMFAILLVKRIAGSESSEMLTDMEWMRLLIVPILTTATIIAIVQRYDILKEWHQDRILFYIAVGMAVMNINIYSLIDDILVREGKIREGQLYKEKVKNETQWYYSISENLDKQRQKAHEYKNHVACLAALVQRKEYSKLEPYLQKMDIDMTQEMDVIDTNHIIVNAILNTKYKEIREKGIVFVLKVNDLSGIWLEDKDIVVLLTNLLSNAIEACESCEERKVIKLKAVIEGQQLIISSKNSISKRPIKEGYLFLTTKEEALQEHGYGIRNILEVIDKYDGHYVIDYDDQEFFFSIIIPQKQG